METEMVENELLPGVSRKLLGYDEYRATACEADILLWEPGDLTGRVIAAFTAGPFCHASLVVRVAGRLFQAAYSEGKDGHLSPLSAEIRRHSGRVSVFRVKERPRRNGIPGRPLMEQEREWIASRLVNSLGGDYAWRNIRLIAYAMLFRWCDRVPALRNLFDRLLDEQARKHTSAICSQDVVRAFRTAAAVPLVPGLTPTAEPLVSPNDIGRGQAGNYVGTLVWPENWKR